MNNALFRFQKPTNEPVKAYAPGSEEKAELKKALHRLASEKWDIPLVIGGREVRTGDIGEVVMPHEHGHVLATYHKAGEKEVRMAIDAAMKAHRQWSEMPWVERASVLQRIAELISTKYRYLVNASVMLGQSKNPFQAEIDAPCELVDFLRFNNYFAGGIYADQPWSEQGVVNRMEYRALEGFVFALTPFNFTAIASNLNMSPVLMGNTTIWKPSSTAIYSNYLVMQLFREAGLPDGVVNFVPGTGSMMGRVVTASPDLAGFHFTGSTATFNYLWSQIGNNLSGYKSYPKIVGETGGKDFIFVHPSADADEVAAAIVRGAFEYQGQKCSAASRAYIPKSLWEKVRTAVGDMLREVKMGDVRDFTNLVNAVIDEASFDNIMTYIEYAKQSPDAEIVFGGRGDKSVGYFIEPTVIRTTDPKFRPGHYRFRVRRCEVRGDARPVRRIVALCPDRFGLRPRPCGRRDRHGAVALCGGQFLHQRQADRRRRLAAAFRRFARVGHQRQGGQRAQPAALDEPAGHQGDARASDRFPVSVPRRKIGGRPCRISTTPRPHSPAKATAGCAMPSCFSA